jgi:arylsulfatase A-like enzyme
MTSSALMRTAVAVTLVAGVFALRAEPAAAAGPPNIVVIMADDQDDSGSIQQMPALRELAKNGVRFTNSFVDFSLCCPSRASFLTGQAAHNSKILGNKPPNGGWQKLKPTAGNTLGVWLQAAGYRTAVMGKLMNGYSSSYDGNTEMPGWNEWDVISDAKGPYRYFGYTLNENGTFKRYGHGAYDYQTDVIAAKGEAFIRSSTGPFFLLMESIAPHGANGDDDEGSEKGVPDAAPRYKDAFDTLQMPITPNFNEKNISDKPVSFQALVPDLKDPGEIQNSFQHRRAAMLAVDDSIRRVVRVLTETGQLDNTYIIVTSDNGYSEGAHRWQGKVVLYEESIRVPLVISGPGIPKGEKRDQLVNNLDVVASIVGWTGATPGRTLDGQSLSPILNDSAAPWRTAMLVQNKNEKGVRTADWMYAVIDESDYIPHGAELYNLQADRWQKRNAIDSTSPEDQAAASSLAATLSTLRNCAGSSCFVTTAQPAASAGR